MVVRYELKLEGAQNIKILLQVPFAHLSILVLNSNSRNSNNANARPDTVQKIASGICNGPTMLMCRVPTRSISKRNILNICGAGETRIDAKEGAADIFANSNNNKPSIIWQRVREDKS